MGKSPHALSDVQELWLSTACHPIHGCVQPHSDLICHLMMSAYCCSAACCSGLFHVSPLSIGLIYYNNIIILRYSNPENYFKRPIIGNLKYGGKVFLNFPVGFIIFNSDNNIVNIQGYQIDFLIKVSNKYILIYLNSNKTENIKIFPEFLSLDVTV